MHPNIWKASGHTDAFNDPLIDNKDSKKRYRADILIEDHIEKIHKKINKEILKGKKRFGDSFNETKFKQTNPNIIRHLSAINAVENRMKKNLEENNLEEIYNLIVDLEISCPISGSKNWTEVRQFNLMFSTEMLSLIHI